VTSPVKACTRFQKFTAGLGASNAWSGSKIAQRTEQTGTTTTKPTTIPPAVNETSSSLPREKTILSRSSLNYVPPPSSPPRSASSNPPAVSSSVGSSFRGGSPPVHDNSKRNADTAKTPSSKPATFSDPFRTPGVPRTVTNQLPPSILFSIPSSVPLRFPFLTDDFYTGVPVNPLLNTVDVISHSVHSTPLPKSPPTPGIPYSPKLKGRIGMLPDEKGAGARGSFPKQLEPLPDPSCSVVMEILPRKFRTQAFILEWLSQFPFRPSRYELVEGRVFIEFETERETLFAWNSPRMSGKEGLHGVRLFRYIATTTPTSEQLGSAKEVNATRTIMNSTRPQSPHKDLASNGYSVSQTARPPSHSPQYKLAPLPQQPSSPPPNVEVHVKDPGSVPTSQTTSNSNTKMSFATHLFVHSSVPSPSTTTGPWVGPTTSSDPSNGRSAAELSTPRDEPFGGAADFAPGASVSPTLVSFPMSPASSSTLAPSSASISPSMVPSLTTSTPDSWHASMVLDDKAPSPSHRRELMQESQLLVETSYPETGGKQDALATVDADEHMESVDSVALAKEVALRQMVLQSRKRKVAASIDGQQPTSDSSAAASRRALEELAVNFISDAISRPPPAKRIKITPSAPALAAWGKRLETHIEKSRIIMAEIQQTQCKAEKDRLWAVLREHNRYVVRRPMLAPALLWMIESIHTSPTA
jgi:hypothetical protein